MIDNLHLHQTPDDNHHNSKNNRNSSNKMSSTYYLLFLTLFLLCVRIQGQSLNNRPVIGVLAQGTEVSHQHYGQEYIDANYVKYLEMAGARVVAIKGRQSKEYYDKMFDQINGVLLPGGGVTLNNSAYANMSHYFFNRAMQASTKGDYFPIWGTCQGFEMLTVMAAGHYVLSHTDSENMTIALKLTPDYANSRLLSKASAQIIQYLTEEPVTANFHKYSLTSKTYMSTTSLNKFYRAISFNYDRKGVQFVSTFEAYKFPFYGVQWHPEKNPFLWESDKSLDHSSHADKVTQYMANFFVDEARKSVHKFNTEEALAKSVIENDYFVYFPETTYQAYFYNVTSLR